MAYPSVTYTFSNGTTASATQVNQNFTDIINGLSDGTKDLSINALTVAGALIANGHTTLGNAAADDITLNGSLASSLAIKTNNSYDIGAATLALAGIYLGAPSSRSTRLRANQSLGASNTLIFPNGNGNAYQALGTDGSGNLSWQWAPGIYASKNDNYQVLDTDGIGFVDVTVINKTITLPTAADNANRIITIRKFVSANGTTTIKGEAAGETVDGVTGTTGITLDFYKETVTLQCTGTVWEVLRWDIPSPQYSLSISSSPSVDTTYRAIGTVTKRRTGEWRLLANIGWKTSTTATSHVMTIADVTFANAGAGTGGQAVTGWQADSSAGAAPNLVRANNSNGQIQLEFTSSRQYLLVTIDCELASKPAIVV